MNANLHLHSRYSDGSLWPEELALSAARLRLSHVALTDHDTFGGTERFVSECARLGIEGIPACEIDVFEPQIDYKSEILAYFPGYTVHHRRETGLLLEKVLKERLKRLEYYLYWSRTIFRRDDLSFDDILKDRMAGSLLINTAVISQLSWSKVDIFLYLKARGLFPIETTYKRFKRDWFGPGRFPKYKLSKPNVSECVQAIHADGGYAVIPHFGHLWNDDIDAMKNDEQRLRFWLGHFRSCGVDGIELYWYSGKRKSQEINDFVYKTAFPMGFFFTFGSDCHGPGTDKHTIDKFSGDFQGFPKR
jgi:hypothetical protein